MVVAEGIERVDEYEAMLELGVDLGQGFYFGQPTERPMAVDPRLVRRARPERGRFQDCEADARGEGEPIPLRCVRMPDRDLFANFERMRREMDELFGDVFERPLGARGAAASRPPSTSTTRPTRRGPSCAPTSRAIDPSEIELEIRGRELMLAGHRRPEGGEERVYQQLEIEHGPFRRVVALGADVDADAAAPSTRTAC